MFWAIFWAVLGMAFYSITLINFTSMVESNGFADLVYSRFLKQDDFNMTMNRKIMEISNEFKTMKVEYRNGILEIKNKIKEKKQ